MIAHVLALVEDNEMYIRFVPDTLNLLAPKEIKLEFTADLLKITPNVKEIYLSNVRNPPLPEYEYFMEYRATWGDLLTRPENVGDDSWIFPLPTPSMTNTTDVPPLEYHNGMFGTDMTQPFFFGKFIVARLAIRPTAKSFNEGAILTVMGAPGCRLTVNGIQETGMVPIVNQIETIHVHDDVLMFKWHGVVRELPLYVSLDGGPKQKHTTINGEIAVPYYPGIYGISSKYNPLKTVDV